MQKIDFEPEFHFNQATRKWDYIYRPYLFVKLINKKRISQNLIKALVDSGSDHNVFPEEFAAEIGLDYKKGMKYKSTTVNEYSFTVYGNRVMIDCGIKMIDTVIYFGENVKIPVLGREGFFNYFKSVSFDIKGKKIGFEK